MTGLVLLLPGLANATSRPLPTVPLSIGLSPASPRAGSEVRLTGGAGAPVWAWDLDGDGQFDDGLGKEMRGTFAAGTHTVSAQAATAAGMVTDTRVFTVHDWNVRPGGTVSATPYAARVGSPVKVTATGDDADGLTVRTELDLDGDGTYETDGATGTATFATPGTRTLRARFTDDAGASSVATTTLDVHTGNIAPTARLAHVPSIPGEIPDGGGFLLLGEDPDGAIVRYEFDADGDGTFELDGGSDPRVPEAVATAPNLRGRVTDDGGAVAVAEEATSQLPTLPPVVPVGTPVKLRVHSSNAPVTWDADGDGDFDDGTDTEITFTYPTAGAYDVHVRAQSGWNQREYVQRVSARAPESVGGPSAQWTRVPVARASVATSSFVWRSAGSTTFETALDINGDGVFAPAESTVATPVLDGPVTAAVRVTDVLGRTAVATSEVPFVSGSLAPDATIHTTDVENPLRAGAPNADLFAGADDVDDPLFSSLTREWDSDGDGAYDDGPVMDGSRPAPASFGVRVTDPAGVSTTLRRTLTPIPQRTIIDAPKAQPWLLVAVNRPRLATLLRRGLTVDVKCTKPRCKTALKITVDAKTARKLKLRSRTVATKTVSGSRQVRVTLTPKAKRALTKVRSVKLTLSATAKAEAGAKSVIKQTLTVKTVAARS